jgi:glucuronate isomerase
VPTLHPDRAFDPDPGVRALARDLHAAVADLPLICPHGHVEPRLLGDPDARFGSPAEMLIIPDHYVTRMLYSQGVPLEALGVPRLDGAPVETDPRAIWRRFAEHFHLFRSTPTGYWLASEMAEVFGVEEQLTRESADAIYDALEAKLAQPETRPRALFDRFNIEVLCTTDGPADRLEWHRALLDDPWGRDPATGRPCVRPTFRPDGVVNLDRPGWRAQLDALSDVWGREVTSHRLLLAALADRRAFFKSLGATATDHAALTAYTEVLADDEAEAIFARALAGQASAEDARRYTGHMLIEMARMSVEDGLVMQLHVGSFRNHNPSLFERFGPDKGADIPVAVEWTRGLQPLLSRFGSDPRLTLILFCLDESTYAREMAPLAGHYPALRLGPPWWFFDSLNGMRRYFDLVMETAGLYNTAGFNDDTRAFPSIPARHDLWRRAAANWVAGLLARHLVDESAAAEMMRALAYDLAKGAYRLG